MQCHVIILDTWYATGTTYTFSMIEIQKVTRNVEFVPYVVDEGSVFFSISDDTLDGETTCTINTAVEGA